jgi:flagellar motor switch protein FliM
MKDLLHLSVGDVIVTETSASTPVVVCVEAEPKFTALVGKHKSNRAIKIVGVNAPKS